MTDRVRFPVDQYALLFDREGDVLLLQATDGEWTLPGGPLEAHEGATESLRYAVREATGLEARIVMPVRTAVVARDGGTFTAVYLCERLTDDPVEVGESFQSHGWFPVESVEPEMLSETEHRAMRKAAALRDAMR